MTMASDGKNLIGLTFDDQKADAERLDGADSSASVADEVEFGKACLVFQTTRKWLDAYFAGRVPEFTPMLKVDGSEFARATLEVVQAIPYGKTATYGEIAQILAERYGKTSVSAQAVGGAVARNPIWVIIPCHRVVGADGSLTGYSGGLELKARLLRHEGVAVEGDRLVLREDVRENVVAGSTKSA